MLLEVDDSQLLLVDFQARLMPAIVDGVAVLANARRLAAVARAFELPIWGTEENPASLGANDGQLRQLCSRTLEKRHFDACADGLVEMLRPPARRSGSGGSSGGGGNARSLPRHLQKAAVVEPADDSRNTIVVAGCEAHVCLLQTALGLLEAEFEVWVVTDACGSRTERDRDAAFDRLAAVGIELVTTEMVAFEWLRTPNHPAFQRVLALIK